MGEDDESEEEVDEPGPEASDSEVIRANISHIYALEGRQRTTVIELEGVIGAQSVLILVDTGSSHDFLHPRVAERMALPLKVVKQFRVYVGNGESLVCSYASLQMRLVIQGNVLIVNLNILPVHGPDVILGMAWLKTLRRVTSDYEARTIEFSRNGQQVCLRLIPPVPRAVSVRTFASLLSLQGSSEEFEVVRISSLDTAGVPPWSLTSHLTCNRNYWRCCARIHGFCAFLPICPLGFATIGSTSHQTRSR